MSSSAGQLSTVYRRALNLRKPIALIALMLFIPASTLPAIVFATPPKDLTPEENLEALWQAQSSAITTAHIVTTLYQHVTIAPKSLSRIDLMGYLETLDAAKPEQCLAKIYSRIGPKNGSTPPWNVPLTIFEDGVKLRNEWSLPSAGNKTRQETTVFNGKEEIRASPVNRQIDLYTGRTGIEIKSLTDIRYLPYLEPATGHSYWKMAHHVAPTITLRHQTSELVVDDASGFVHRLTLRDSQNHPIADVLQFGPTEVVPSGHVPTLTVRTQYTSQGEVATFFAYWVHTIQANIECPPGTFDIASPAHTMIVDNRANALRPTISRTFQEEPSVLLFANAMRQGAVPSHKSARHSWWLAYVALGLLSGTGAVIYWRRKSFRPG